ncbi:MAG: TraB/GumN family protein, partial [Caulobacteraceae bacterium]
MITKVVGAVALVSALLVGAAPARAEPAMWTVKDADSTLYLFGTVHLLRPDRSWMTPKIKAALASCQDLSLEITDGDPVAMAGLMHKYGVDPTRRLSASMPAKDWARLTAAAATLGATPQQFEPMRPWFAGLQLTLGAVIKAGYQPDAGVEKILRAEAEARRAPIAGLETAESQIALLAALPEDVQVAFLRQSLDEFEDAAEALDEMADAWEKGD